jgi:hypothetical protein
MVEIHRFTSTLFRLDSAVFGLAFLIPPEIAQPYAEKKVKRFVFTINGEMELHRTMLPIGEGRHILYLNQDVQKKLGLPLGAQAEITMRVDKSKYGMDMPEEMAECLAAYPKADDYFHALTPGKQRTLIHMVASLKRVDSRVKKAVQIMEYLEHYRGKLDFKALHAWIKASNAR